MSESTPKKVVIPKKTKKTRSDPSFSHHPQSNLKAQDGGKKRQPNEDLESVLVYDMENRTVFVSKIGLIFIIYFGFTSLIVTYIQKNKEAARELFIHSRLEVSLSLYLILTLVCKMLFSVFGSMLKKLALIVFVIDLYFTYMCVLGLYFTFNKTRAYYSDSSQYVVINSFIMTVNSIIFFLSSFKQSQNKPYDYISGVALMIAATIITVYTFKIYYPVEQLGQSKYLILIIVHCFINIYWAYNTFLIVTVRSKRFYSDDYIYAFMCFWGDWFSNFWFSIVHGGVIEADRPEPQKPKRKFTDSKQDVHRELEVSSGF